MNDLHEGGCLCGALRYSVTGPPERTTACACRNCQRRSGSPFGFAGYFQESQVTFNDGAVARFRPATDSGRVLENRFCPTCGTTVAWSLDLFPGILGLPAGSFDQPCFWFEPARFIFARGKPDWVSLPPELECHEGTPPYAAPR